MPHEDELAALARAVEAQIPFNRVVGLQLGELSPAETTITFEMRDELVGNFARGSLHGGVISAALDVVGGMAAITAAVAGSDVSTLAERFGKLGTIDLRIDYLRPGVGEKFTASGVALRTGNKVAVTRMELHNEEGTLIAVGTGTYLIG